MTGPSSGWPPQRRVQRQFARVVATTDVHSSLDQAEQMAAQLCALRDGGALIADCGDFFEGSGYYVLGGSMYWSYALWTSLACSVTVTD